MGIFEYDKELEEKKLRKAEYEAGFSDGEKSGHETGFSEGHKSGFSEGRESGFSEGQNHAAIETARRMLQSNKFTTHNKKQAAKNVAAESKHSATLIPADNGMDASNIFIFLLLYLLFFTLKTHTYFTISISFPYVINK